MYLEFFGLADEPFRITPDPRYLHLDPLVETALATVADGIERRAGLVLLVGEVGTGKTTLVRRLLDSLPPHVRTVLVLHPTVSFDEMLDHLLLELGVPVASGDPEALRERLAEFLREHARNGGTVAVFFDEAQALHGKTLARLPALLDLVTDAGRPALQVVLAGQPELDIQLEAPTLAPLRGRIGAVARLAPMSPERVAEYVRARLARAGAPDAALFEPAAIERIATLSGGVPRVVNVLCQAALVAAFADGRRQVSAPLVDAAWADYAPLHRPEGAPMPAPPAAPRDATPATEARPLRRRAVAAAVAVAALAGLALLAIQPRWAWPPDVGRGREPATARPAPDSVATTAQPPPVAPTPVATTRPPASAEPPAAPPVPIDAPLPRQDVPPLPRAAPPATRDAIEVVDRFWRAYAAGDADGVRALFAPDAAPAAGALDLDPTGGGQLAVPTGLLEAKPVGDRVTVRVPFFLDALDDRGEAVPRQGVASLQVAVADGAPRLVAFAAESVALPVQSRESHPLTE